jgi:outer membrane immunogenic protein
MSILSRGKSMFRKMLVVAIAAVAMAGTGSAADLDNSSHSWTGIYGGVVGSAGMFSHNFVEMDDDFVVSTDGPSDLLGYGAGGTIGFNYQIGSAVLGIEGDWTYVKADEDYIGQDLNSGGPGGDRYTVEWSSYSTVRGRLGYAFDNVLIYGTGGIALADIESNLLDGIFEGGNHACGVQGSRCFDENRMGLAFGIGGEVAVTESISVKGEYLGMIFEDQSKDQEFSPNGNDAGPDNGVASQADAHVVRIGLNYNFMN